LFQRQRVVLVHAGDSIDGKSAAELAKAAAAKTAEAAKQGVAKTAEVAKQGVNTVKTAVKNLELPGQLPDIDVDIGPLVKLNFLAQVVLTGVSWAVVFFSTHAGLAKGQSVNLATVFLMLGVVASALSTFLSYGYFKKVQSIGTEVLEGMKAVDKAFDHMIINFGGIAATLIALQAEVGLLFMSVMAEGGKAALKMSTTTQDYSSIAAMAQAAANVLTAHIVSLLFLFLIIKKVNGSTKKLIEWSEQMRASLVGAIRA